MEGMDEGCGKLPPWWLAAEGDEQRKVIASAPAAAFSNSEGASVFTPRGAESVSSTVCEAAETADTAPGDVLDLDKSLATWRVLTGEPRLPRVPQLELRETENIRDNVQLTEKKRIVRQCAPTVYNGEWQQYWQMNTNTTGNNCKNTQRQECIKKHANFTTNWNILNKVYMLVGYISFLIILQCKSKTS